jgi:hypothetical protein
MCKARNKATCIVNLLNDLNHFLWSVNNMNRFSHFHCSNLKLLNYPSTRITKLYFWNFSSYDVLITLRWIWQGRVVPSGCQTNKISLLFHKRLDSKSIHYLLHTIKWSSPCPLHWVRHQVISLGVSQAIYPTWWAMARPFHDIEAWGGKFKAWQIHVQTHFAHNYYKCICNRKWWCRLPVMQLLATIILYKIRKIVEGRRHWLITCSAMTMQGQVPNTLQLLFTNVS